MSTVGYGELSPISNLGKLVTVVCAFTGVLVQAAMVLSTYKMLEMTKSQMTSYVMINSVNTKAEAKNKAILMLQLSFKLKRASQEKYAEII